MIDPLKILVERHCPGWKPSVIADIGAHDGTETLELAAHWPQATVLAMECCPNMYPTCLERVSGCSNIKFFAMAAGSVDGVVTFHQSAYHNKGTGSIYKPAGTYPFEPVTSREIQVPSSRLDTLLSKLEIPGIDLFWLDAQGAELDILRGLGDGIAVTRVVYAEYMLQEIYVGQPLIGDLKEFLSSKGFTLVNDNPVQPGWWGDCCFIRL